MQENSEEIKRLSTELTKSETELDKKLLNVQQEHEEIVRNLSKRLSETEQKLTDEMKRSKEINVNIQVRKNHNWSLH